MRDTGNEVEMLVGRSESHSRGFNTFGHNGVVHINRQIVGVAILKAKVYVKETLQLSMVSCSISVPFKWECPSLAFLYSPIKKHEIK